MFKQRQSYFSAVTKPTVQRVMRSKALTNSQAEQLLTSFFTDVDSASLRLAAASSSTLATTTSNASAIAQLKRVQRDLRGLPPSLQPPVSRQRRQDGFKVKNNRYDEAGVAGGAKKVSEKQVNKHITFDEDPVEPASNEEKETDVKAVNNNSSNNSSSDEDNFVDSKMELDEDDKEPSRIAQIELDEDDKEPSKIAQMEDTANLKEDNALHGHKVVEEGGEVTSMTEDKPEPKKDKKADVKKEKKSKKSKKEKKEKKSKKSSK